MVPCLSGGPGLLLGTPSVVTVHALQAVSTQPTIPLPGSDLWSLSFGIQLPSPPADECQSREPRAAVPAFREGYFPFCLPRTSCCSLLLNFPLPLGWSLQQGGNFPRCRNFPPSQIPPQDAAPSILIPFYLFFFSFSFCHTQLPGCFLRLSEVWGLLLAVSRCSMWIIPLVFLMFSGEMVSSTSYSWSHLKFWTFYAVIFTLYVYPPEFILTYDTRELFSLLFIELKG